MTTSTITALPSASALTGTEIFSADQGITTVGITANQVSTFIQSIISTTRTITTATTNQTVFTAASYVIGSNKLRVFVNGVRQFNNSPISDYTETSTTSFTFAIGRTLGDVIVAEVN